ncbi:2-dehydro-3-deoxy-6-phosphogalactonate aldolase [Agaribacterium haliotis]|uniref:2-dehydro-3-deoxy-6-phosphogalactonate aldolase n=1 Tax=Agaribacterium haliotis TaxID=2013869 RepID=UPI000BB5566F|nr:2-dehydro-3-deoxy-6-phosphogalactonate aldolase [Agaribacterium haliotis]
MTSFDMNKQLPLIAILRGVKSSEVLDVAKILIDEGFTMIEVPLNSPDALSSIRLLVEHFGDDYLVGAGTVTNSEQADAVIATGAKLIVTPNYNEAVVKHARSAACVCLPGVVTPTEAFAALAAGASGLKLFPISQIGVEGFKALKSVLPSSTLCLPVGGINPTPESMKLYMDIGAAGFGLGSALYRAGMSLEQIQNNARSFVSVFNAIKAAK